MKHTTIHRQNHLVWFLHVSGNLYLDTLCRGQRTEATYSTLNPDCPVLYTTTVLFHLLLGCLQVVSRLCFFVPLWQTQNDSALAYLSTTSAALSPRVLLVGVRHALWKPKTGLPPRVSGLGPFQVSNIGPGSDR